VLVGAVLVTDATLQCNQLLVQHVSHRVLFMTPTRQSLVSTQVTPNNQHLPSLPTLRVIPHRAQFFNLKKLFIFDL